MEEYEIDLRQCFFLLWDRKWIIIGLIILAMLGAFIHSYVLTARTYEASSEVLIIPPIYPEIEVSKIPPRSYLSIAGSPLALQRVIENLDLRDEEGGFVTVRRLERMTDLALVVEEDEDVFSIVFKAKNTDESIPIEIVNTWAEIFMEDVLEIRQAEIEEISNVITRRYEETEDKLDAALDELLEFREKARLDRLETTKNTYQRQIEKNEQNLIELEQKLGQKKVELERIEIILTDMQDEDGTWLGDLTKATIEEMRPEMYEIVKNYRDLRENLLEFRKEHDIQAKNKQLEFHEEMLAFFREQKSELEQQLNLAREKMKEIEVLLAQEPDRWELAKSLTEDALWERIFSPEEIDVLSQITLTEEIVNPIYRSLRGQEADLGVELSALPSHIEYYEEKIKETEGQIEQVRQGVLVLEDQEGKILSDLALYRSLYSQRQADFEDLKNEYFALRIELERLETDREFLVAEQERMEERFAELEEQLWKFEVEKERLERKVSEYESTYRRLSGRAEDARLAMAEQTSDVRFISEAVPPADPVGRGTALNMALAGVLAGMVGVFGVFFHKFLKDDEEKAENA